MKIGTIETKSNIFLAPMAGVTDYAFRKLCEEHGAGMVYSEMVSAKGLYYNDKKTESLLKGKHDCPYAVQIFGSEPDIIKEVAAQAASYGDILDINMGCPTPKIVNNGDGSALMKNRSLAGKIVKAAVLSAKKPVTVKIRLGWDSPEFCVDFAKELEANGAAAIAVHGRTRAQFYSGEADWSYTEKIASSLNIPVIGNGDIHSFGEACEKLENTSCSAVMIGRGAEGNPFIFSENIPSVQEKLETALRHVRMLTELKGESRAIKEARKHIAWYIKGMPSSSELKIKIFKATKYQEIESLLSDFTSNFIKTM